jgi:CHASE3 domain sensor protein
MKLVVGSLLAGCVMASSAAVAQQMTTDDLKWVNQCIRDNRGGASADIIRKYCMCMNEKMDENETRSISEWEKANPRARAACDKESGWK